MIYVDLIHSILYIMNPMNLTYTHLDTPPVSLSIVHFRAI